MRKYLVYIHINKVNNKKYIGITSCTSEERWRNGLGYSKRQPIIHNAIKKYGWDGFEHKILFENLSETEAKKIERKLIAEYNTTDPTFGYNMTIGGDGHCVYRTEEERQKARLETAARSLKKLNADPIRKEKDLTRRRTYANTKYANLKNDTAGYIATKEAAKKRATERQSDPVEHQKILEARKRCKQKAMQDPAKKTKILEANKAAKEKVKAIRQELFQLYEVYPSLFTSEDIDIAFTKFSKDSGCFKYNSAKRLQQILDNILLKKEELNK